MKWGHCRWSNFPSLGEGSLQTKCTNRLLAQSASAAQRWAPRPIRQPLWRLLSSSLVKRENNRTFSLLSHLLWSLHLAARRKCLSFPWAGRWAPALTGDVLPNTAQFSTLIIPFHDSGLMTRKRRTLHRLKKERSLMSKLWNPIPACILRVLLIIQSTGKWWQKQTACTLTNWKHHFYYLTLSFKSVWVLQHQHIIIIIVYHTHHTFLNCLLQISRLPKIWPQVTSSTTTYRVIDRYILCSSWQEIINC